MQGACQSVFSFRNIMCVQFQKYYGYESYYQWLLYQLLALYGYIIKTQKEEFVDLIVVATMEVEQERQHQSPLQIPSQIQLLYRKHFVVCF